MVPDGKLIGFFVFLLFFLNIFLYCCLVINIINDYLKCNEYTFKFFKKPNDPGASGV